MWVVFARLSHLTLKKKKGPVRFNKKKRRPVNASELDSESKKENISKASRLLEMETVADGW